ncbi:hypothetical protein ARAM_001975 [Aspergillus rambellii]|uniref:Man(5)GlcNAc(2)-PP-dolichol translocation protein RFT1 n=1 Tax=Aspergillus rambellii TaxID=308745 RepID=A0A0F8X439_9EURO|nr:hypothetical protein ARAM_001975 [Aspergillus rambellii]
MAANLIIKQCFLSIDRETFVNARRLYDPSGFGKSRGSRHILPGFKLWWFIGPSKVSENQGANIKAAKSHLVNIMQGYMRWTVPDVDTLLALYCYYIPFLAFNGISEAFVSSTASPAEVRKQAGWMSLFSTCFALAAYLFLQIGGLGARGLVYANIVNMAVRIIWSFSFIRRYLRQYKQDLALAEFSVRPHTYVAGAVITAVLYQAEFWPKFNGALTPFIFGAIYILLVFYFERDYIIPHYTRVYQLLRTRVRRSKSD